MYCRCRKAPEGFTAKRDPDGTFNYDYWVCSRCQLPTRHVWEALTLKYVLKSATALLSFDGKEDGRNILHWAMTDGSKVQTMVFAPYPRKVDMDQGRNILVELWHRLDSNIDQIRSTQTDSALLDYEKAQANCHAATIALIMSPFYEDATAVLKESMARWTARQEGREHESPGLAEAIWDPATRFDGTPFSRESASRARNVGASTPVRLDDQKIAFIKHCLANGIQTPETLASMFQCSIDDIKAANDS